MFQSKKRKMAFVLFAFLWVPVALSFSACANSPQKTGSQTVSATDQPASFVESETASQNSEAQPMEFTMATLSLGENLSVDYPQILDPGWGEENDFLRQTVEAVVQADLSGQASGVSANLTGEVTYWDGRILCFVLEGLWNDSSAAHPVSLWTPILMDLESQTLVSLADLMPVDEEFIAFFRQAYGEQVVSGLGEKLQTDLSQEAESLQQLLDQTTDDAIRSALSQTALDSDGSFQGFFTDTGMGVSVALPHALGDHFEVCLERK